MKTTVRGAILQFTEVQKVFLDNLMGRYCAAVRWSFKRLLDGWKTQDIRLTVQGKFSLNPARPTTPYMMPRLPSHHRKNWLN